MQAGNMLLQVSGYSNMSGSAVYAHFHLAPPAIHSRQLQVHAATHTCQGAVCGDLGTSALTCSSGGGEMAKAKLQSARRYSVYDQKYWVVL